MNSADELLVIDEYKGYSIKNGSYEHAMYLYIQFPPCSHLGSSTDQIPTSQSKDSSSPDLKLSPWCRIT